MSLVGKVSNYRPRHDKSDTEHSAPIVIYDPDGDSHRRRFFRMVVADSRCSSLLNCPPYLVCCTCSYSGQCYMSIVTGRRRPLSPFSRSTSRGEARRDIDQKVATPNAAYGVDSKADRGPPRRRRRSRRVAESRRSSRSTHCGANPAGTARSRPRRGRRRKGAPYGRLRMHAKKANTTVDDFLFNGRIPARAR